MTVLTSVAYGVVLGHRQDYLGHYLAGLGATLLLIVASAVLLRASAWTVVFVTIVAIGLGYLTEATVFRFAIFDPVDFLNQSIGACIAGLALAGRARTAFGLSAVVIIGSGTLVAGFAFAFA